MSDGISIKRPISVFNKDLKVNFKDIFKTSGKIAVDVITANWQATAKDSLDFISAAGLKDDCGHVAWRLIYSSLMHAVFSLVAESKDLFTKTPDNMEILAEQLDMSLETMELTIDKGFFNRPGDLPLIEAFKTPFSQWLGGFGLSQMQARGICNRLSSNFVAALIEEWRLKPADYQCLENFFDTPFSKAFNQEQAWRHYYAALQINVDERMFNEAFSLRNIYIPLRAYYCEKDDDHRKREFAKEEITEKKEKRIVVALEGHLEEWLNKSDRQDAVRLISGGPGCGKSSFAKMFAASLADKGLKVLYIPLHQFALENDLVDAVGKFVRFDGFIKHNPLDPEEGEKRLFIIFDGLDELVMQGKIAAETALEFVREVLRKTDRLNLNAMRLQVLLTGRELVAQANAAEFRRQGQILHILPYYVPEQEKTDKNTYEYIDPQKIIKTDQRQIWWKTYGALTGLGYQEMPEPLRKISLTEITSQPLLNYLVALSFARKKINFEKETNLNAIYEDLIGAVYERGYEKYRHTGVVGISEKEFFRMLEEIAVAAWHGGDGRTTTISEIERHCGQSGLTSVLKKFSEGAEKGLLRLLTAFYFRQAGERHFGDRTFEFTHKSFGEYLTARRIVLTVRQINKHLELKKDDPDSGWNDGQALEAWIKLCGPTTMDSYLHKFICNEMWLQDRKLVGDWQKSLCELIEFMLSHGMPFGALATRPSYLEECRQARNAEEALLCVLSSCARFTKQMSDLKWPSPIAFGEWISRLQGQRMSAENVLALGCLDYLNLQDSILPIRDFYKADFCQSNLKNVRLAWANLIRANLEGANLEGANLIRANLDSANLKGANLTGANLEDANLVGANFERANLEKANLENANLALAKLAEAKLQSANLHEAHLVDANLHGANLERANLVEAYLHSANLESANLHGANLEKANLNGVKLERANLSEAKLAEAKLQSANLEGANLTGANLTGANIQGANFKEANLEGAYFHRAKLERANLQGANLKGVKGLK